MNTHDVVTVLIIRQFQHSQTHTYYIHTHITYFNCDGEFFVIFTLTTKSTQLDGKLPSFQR